MKKIYSLKLLLMLLLLITITVVSTAQNFKLIDLNTLKSSNPSNYSNTFYSTKDSFAVLNGIFYFGADDGMHGVELYSSDGTAEGTKPVKDINPGTASSNPLDIIVTGDKLYLIASLDNNYQQLWVSDGTADGTQQLSNLNIDIGYYYTFLSYLTDVNGVIYFVVNNAELWKSDGTQEGTVMVINFYNFNYSSPQQLENVNGVLFFTSADNNIGTGIELFKSDGTAEGTTIVKDINLNPYESSNPSHLTSVDGLLYFAAYDGAGNTLWVSDGTEEGTQPVKNDQSIYVAADYYIDDPFTVRNNMLFFQGGKTGTGNELCKYNTKDAVGSIRLVKDIIPGETSSNPTNITNVRGTLFFNTSPDTGDKELWKSNGTEAGTVLVKDINPGEANYYGGFINVKGALFFYYFNNESGSELWKSDGTADGTVIVEDIYPGAKSSGPYFLTYSNGILLFAASKGAKGTELWKSDGTKEGTEPVKDINTTTSGGSYPNGFTAVDSNKVVFSASDQKHYGLWVTNGTVAGTDFVKSIDYYSATPFKGKAYFLTATDSGYALAKTDGTKGGTKVFYQFNNYSYIPYMVAADKLLYFPVYNNVTGQYDLWRSNGIASGTYIIKPNINPYNQPVAVGNTLFFNNYDDEHGYELWKSNGTTKGTTLVKDIIPGTESSDPQNLHSFNGKLFFSAINYYNYVLYSSDGTEAGTTLVKYVAVGSNFAQANGKLFFYGYRNIAKGSELYGTDGTEAGTYLVKDIAQGPMSSNVGGTFYSGDTLIYFIAYDLKHGSELWRSNGTKAGTYLLKNITPGDGGTYLYPPGAVNINDNLIFVINDTLWQSDGTKQGTHRVHDKTVEGVFAIFELTAAHGKVYFAGNTYAAGREVYVGKIDGETGKFVVSKTTNEDAVKTSLPFSAVLYPNPVKNTLNIKIAAGNIKNVTLLITDVSGKTMLAKSTFAGNGEIITQLNVSRLSAGTYFLKIINTDGSENAMMKFVK